MAELAKVNLFNDKEISWIIHTLRAKYGSNLFGDCDYIFSKGVNEGVLLPEKLIPRNSASITDVVLGEAEFPDGNLKIAMKIWFGWDKFNRAEIDQIFENMCDNEKPCSDDSMKDIIWKMRVITIDKADISTSYRLLKNTLKQKDMFESLEYEANVYKYITDNIIVTNVCPGFIPLIATRKCSLDSIYTALSYYPSRLNGRLELIKKVNLLRKGTQGIGKELDINFMVTGSGNLEKMNDFISSPDRILVPRDFYSIIFQLFYCLYVMDAYKIQHSDLHFGNIFVQTLPSSINMKFNINGKVKYLQTEYIVKIYDFDRAVVDSLGPNPRIYRDHAYGSTDTFTNGYDLASVLCGLGHYDNDFITLLLNSISGGLGDISKDIAYKSRPSAKTDYIELDPDLLSYDFLYILRALTPRSVDPDGTKYYNLPLGEIKDPGDMMYIKSILEKLTKNKNEFLHLKSIMIIMQNDDLFLHKQHACLPTHEYDIPPITDFFETSIFDDFIAVMPSKPGYSAVSLEYTFIKP